MSFVFTVKLQKKEKTFDRGIVVLELYTTPARELYDNVDLISYSEDYVVLSDAKVDEILSFYNSEIDRFKAYTIKERNKVNRLERTLKDAGSTDVFNEILNKLSDAEEDISYWEEEMEAVKSQRDGWLFIRDLLELQYDFEKKDNPYELVYIAN